MIILNYCNFFRIYFYSFIKTNKDCFIQKIIKNTILKLELEIRNPKITNV